MATNSWLSHYQTIRSSSECLVVAIEDVSDLWPGIKESFETRIPLKRAFLSNKARNPITVENLPVEFILTTDARLRARVPLDQSPFLFRHPYATILLVSCEDLDDYKGILKPRLRLMVQNDEREWFIIFVSRANATDQAVKAAKKVYSKLEVDFSSKKRERCCKLDLSSADPAAWEDIDNKMVECIRNTLDRRAQLYEDEIKKLSDNRFMPGWSFCNFFIVKECLAFMFELTHLHEDALREYDELEQVYLEIVNSPVVKHKEFGGLDPGDDHAAVLDVTRKSFMQFALEDSFREFDFRQYLFARQISLLFNLNRPIDVAARGFSFVTAFSRSLSTHEKDLPFCLREVWVITACMSLVKATTERFAPRTVNPEAEKDFYHILADLISKARTKLMRLADLIGYGCYIEQSPCNSACLSMLPWPKPAIWPSVPADAIARILAKEQATQDSPRSPLSNKSKLLLSPSMLLREANRRRASLSAGNLGEMLSLKESPVVEGTVQGSIHSAPQSPLQRSSSGTGQTTNSMSPGSPTLLASKSARGIDRPMKLAEVHAAAESALLRMVTDKNLNKALSSPEGYQELYLELTRTAADNYHRSWRKRHGVIFDGEVAAVHYRSKNYDSAAKLYEKVCALYSGERWHTLLAQVLPRLADCQKQLGDLPGYLSSCAKLLSLEEGLLSMEEKKEIQSDLVKLAHGGLKVPVSLDVSRLITFSGKLGPPLEICEGDPGILEVTAWSGFPEDISLESLSLTLISTMNSDDGVKIIKSAETSFLEPGKNSIKMQLPPQKPGSYILGVLTGHIGQIKVRSHTYCTTSAISSKGGSPESDDYLSTEKPLRPVLQVLKPRPLVDIKAVVAEGLLLGEPQWLGLVIEPINYALREAILHLIPGPNLSLYDPQICQLQPHDFCGEGSFSKPNVYTHSENEREPNDLPLINGLLDNWGVTSAELKGGKIELPQFASNQTYVMWLRVSAKRIRDESSILALSETCRIIDFVPLDGTAVLSQTYTKVGISQNEAQSNLQPTKIPDEDRRVLDVKLEYGMTRNRVYERSVEVVFTEAFRTITRVVTKGNDGKLLLQVTLKSQLNATITVMGAELKLQDGFCRVSGEEGKPDASWLLPIRMSPLSESALIFVIRLNSTYANGVFQDNDCDVDDKASSLKSLLEVSYKITGDRLVGAHAPAEKEKTDLLVFRSPFLLQTPVLDRLLAVGMLPVPSECPRVGEQVVLKWRIERLREGWAASLDNADDIPEKVSLEVSEPLKYEMKADHENWMIAGRKKGNVFLPLHSGARVIISIACVPLVTGHVRPPSLHLLSVCSTHITHSPPGPHLICVLPPAQCYAFCVTRSPN